jgi:N-acetylglucosaminyl-diphospho-decaprenol L-rhamnosyltransferase
MLPPKFSVIIVNYNGGRYLQGAVESLAHQTRSDFEVLIVDNASSDGSFDGLQTDGLERVVRLPQTDNLGFARANNVAARRATGEWLVLLNPDAEATPCWLEAIDAGINRYRGVTMFASAQIDLDSRERLDGAGDCYLGFGIPWRGGFGRRVDELPGAGECFSPCGAGAVFRRESFLSVGGFDETFFCFCEDVDLGFRLRLRGDHCVFLPDAVINHAGGGLSGRTSAFALKHGARNRIWTYAKNMPMPALLLTLPGHVLFTLVILARGMFTGRLVDTWRGVLAGIAGLGPVLAERKTVQRCRKISQARLLAVMSWNPLAMLRRKTVIRPLTRFSVHDSQN